MTTIRDAITAIESINISRKKSRKTAIADKLLGKYKGIVPKNKSSTEYIRQLRTSLYDKT